ncbi:protein of unassigned function [Methylobacterium oryzae CBMB20]|uniref:Protein of unassigned function n=1 Tax=Methylobacterium oryzae CBMB20 TaxID=693986 RepID=A0A089NW93_9HYPH|nr:protein of unassigned function [Methylobacterium oryzae CBMB20]
MIVNRPRGSRPATREGTPARPATGRADALIPHIAPARQRFCAHQRPDPFNDPVTLLFRMGLRRP